MYARIVFRRSEMLGQFLSNGVKNTNGIGNYSEFNEDKMRKQLGENNISIFEVVQKLFLAGGLPFIEEDTLIHWAYRDVLTAVQHFMVKP